MSITGDGDTAVWIFGRGDVFLVYLVCLLPLAIACVGLVKSEARGPAGQTTDSGSPISGLSRGLGWLSIGYIGFLAWRLLGNNSGDPSSNLAASLSVPTSLFAAHLMRLLVLLPCVPALIAVSRVALPRLGTDIVNARIWRLTLVLTTLFVPLAYADSVAVGLQGNLKQALEEDRIATAYRTAGKLLQLRPGERIFEVPLTRLFQDLNTAHTQLLVEANTPLPEAPVIAEIARRITVLIRLDRNAEALAALRPITEGPEPNPTAWDYLGLCHQRLDQPEASLAAYRRAEQIWRQRPESPDRLNGLANAHRGIAYAARQLGKRALEEDSYRSLVEIRASGESHFLLAQCYREHQKTELAASHFRIAAEMSPDLKPAVATILKTMRSDHFGCLRVGG